MNDDIKNSIELVSMVAWTYLVGYLLATAANLDQASMLAVLFGLVGFGIAVFGIERRRQTGKYPIIASLLLIGFFFTCFLFGLGIYLLRLLAEYLDQ